MPAHTRQNLVDAGVTAKVGVLLADRNRSCTWSRCSASTGTRVGPLLPSGLEACQAGWALESTCHNLMKLFRSGKRTRR